MSRLTTIGYEAADLDDFIATLRIAGVDLVLDIRDVPVSRRRGFSKSSLANRLEVSGISYLHLKALGDPKDGRDAAREGRHADFVRIFKGHLSSIPAQEQLREAAQLASKHVACLLCYERDPRTCHRKLVAEAMSAIVPVQIEHLGVRAGLANDTSAWTGTSPNPR